jgi:hypothetical protein
MNVKMEKRKKKIENGNSGRMEKGNDENDTII